MSFDHGWFWKNLNCPCSRSLRFHIKYFENGYRYDDGVIGVNGSRIGNHPLAIDWHRDLWPWMTLNRSRWESREGKDSSSGAKSRHKAPVALGWSALNLSFTTTSVLYSSLPNFALIVTYCLPCGSKYRHNTALFNRALKCSCACTDPFANHTSFYIIMFLSCGFFYLLLCSFYLFSWPNLSGRKLDVYHTSTHGAALVQI